MKVKIVRCFIQYPFSQLELEGEIIQEGEAGCCIKMSTPKGHNRAIPFDGNVILNCSYEEENK